jgi:peptidoglycan/xylan/chitin deacetylase (PgdA/CDA1 family)
MTYQQTSGRVKIPAGKKVAVGLGVDFDAMSIWDGSFHKLSPAYLARGEFGAEVAAQRLLKLFEKQQIKTTWCIPGHTVDTFPNPCKEALAAGHEIAHHGYAHENPTEVDKDAERQVLQRGLESLARIGVKPRGYRSPYWDFSPNTLNLLEELGFEWDSSLMANDLHPYYPRMASIPSTVKHGNYNVASAASTFSQPSKVLEIPVSWYLDDFPAMEYITGMQEGMTAVVHIEERWRDIYNFAANEEEGCCFPLTIHPQTSGRAHMIQMLDRLISYMKANGAAFMTLSEIADATEIQRPAQAVAAGRTQGGP